MVTFHDPLIYVLDSDDEEDIAVHRKPHRNAIKDSDSEEEEAAADTSVCMAEALVLSESSGEEAEADQGKARVQQRSRRISQAPVDSDDSGPELERCGDAEEQEQREGRGAKSSKEQKKREKSQRHREKKEKRCKAVEKLKKNKDRLADISEVGGNLVFFFFTCHVKVN